MEHGLDDKAADIEIRVLNVSKKELVKDFEDAVDFAEKSPQPDTASILVDVDSGLLGGK